jgi:hypothetical protein
MSKGKNKEMEWEEYFMLMAVDNGKGAKKSKLYYNNHNGGILNKNTEKVLNLMKCEKLIKMINDDTLFPVEERDKELQRNIEDFQGGREETFQGQIERVKYEVNLAGNLINTDPYIIFEGKAKSGGDLGAGGIHTKWGVLASNSEEMKIKLVSHKFVKDLTVPEIRNCVMKLNPQPLKFKKIPTQKDAVKILKDNYISDKIEAKDPINSIQLKEWGYTRINPIIEQAEKEIKLVKDDDKNKRINRQRLLYDTPQYDKDGKTAHPEGRKEFLNKRLDLHNIKGCDKNGKPIFTDTIAVGFSAGGAKSAIVKILDIVRERKKNGITKINKVILTPYGNKAGQLKSYELNDKKTLEERIECICPNAEIELEPVDEFIYPDIV